MNLKKRRDINRISSIIAINFVFYYLPLNISFLRNISLSKERFMIKAAFSSKLTSMLSYGSR
jgi:hypothetical protein